jgi:hemoglobin
MLCLLLVIAASLGLLALLPAVAEAQWCAGAYDAKQGTNFGACPAGPTVSLYKRLGGRHPIAVVVDSFVANLVADSRVNARFKALKPAEVNRLKANLSDQICEATGGPCSYLGRDMKTTHQGMRITEAEWSATVENLVKALDQHKVGAGEKQELLGKLGPMKADIVGQ